MRVILKEYAKGGRNALETTDDGGEAVREWAGPRKVGARICAYVEVACDNTENGVDRALEGLAWLMEELRSRKDEYSEKKKTAKRKASA